MKNLDIFVESLKENLGDNLRAVIAFGSQANVRDAISKPVKKWVKAKNPLPVVMTNDEWYSSFDVYAIEYSDMKDNYKLIYGEDLVNTVNINKYYLRLQCEAELKSLLLKYKNNFLMNIRSDREMKKVLDKVIKTLLVIFRAVLRLHDCNVPYRAVDIIDSVSNYLSFNKIVLNKLAKVKYEGESCNKQELLFIENQLLIDIQSLLKQVDAMQF